MLQRVKFYYYIFKNVTFSNEICMLISGANEPLQRWEMCVETLQRFMGFAVAVLQHQAMNEADINAATNVVSVIHNGLNSFSGFMVAGRWRMCTVLCPCISDETHHCHYHY